MHTCVYVHVCCVWAGASDEHMVDSRLADGYICKARGALPAEAITRRADGNGGGEP